MFFSFVDSAYFCSYITYAVGSSFCKSLLLAPLESWQHRKCTGENPYFTDNVRNLKVTHLRWGCKSILIVIKWELLIQVIILLFPKLHVYQSIGISIFNVDFHLLPTVAVVFWSIKKPQISICILFLCSGRLCSGRILGLKVVVDILMNTGMVSKYLCLSCLLTMTFAYFVMFFLLFKFLVF